MVGAPVTGETLLGGIDALTGRSGAGAGVRTRPRRLAAAGGVLVFLLAVAL